MFFLVVLKWIGIIILVLLALILLILALVLLVPIRYHIAGSFADEVPDGAAEARWFAGLLKAEAVYHRSHEPGSGKHQKQDELTSGSPGDASGKSHDAASRASSLTAVIRVGGRVVYDFLADGEVKTAKEAEQKAEAEKDQDHLSAAVQSKADPGKTDGSIPAQSRTDEKLSDEDLFGPEPTLDCGLEHAESPDAEEKTAAGASADISDTADTDTDREHSRERPCLLERLTKTVSGAYQDFSMTLRAILRVLQQKKDGCKKLLGLWQAEENEDAVALLKKQILKVLKELRPRKGGGFLRIGTGDPYSTARLMEIAALLYPLWHGRIDIIPEMSESIHEADADIRGRLRLLVPGWAALRIFCCSRLRQMYRQAKRIVDEELRG